MICLTLRTDKPEAEIGLYDDANQLSYQHWEAHRELAETIHLKIKEVLEAHSLGLADLQAVAIYAGPGSFTGLRIGITVANALATSLDIPIVATTGDDWLETGMAQLADGSSARQVTPEYGSLPNITAPRR
ncbi:MAG: tRNA (adenosine(37)-N6)-threonylcarbamoyltransferase complex dimerization subunit type 1 TsaB [Candidatus Saccharimonadales bacterium]